MVDSILARYGFKWELYPYRITDQNDKIIQRGPYFDVTEATLKAQYNASLRRERSLFNVPVPKQK